MPTTTMVARSIQISLNADLLREVDGDREAKQRGRSALIQRALRLYLDLKKRKSIDAAYERAYAGHADEVLEDFSDLLRSQAWPTK